MDKPSVICNVPTKKPLIALTFDIAHGEKVPLEVLRVLRSLDWKNPGVNRIIPRVLKRVHPGDIILMHASDSSRQTEAALPYIIEGLRKRGYKFVKVSTMVRMAERM